MADAAHDLIAALQKLTTPQSFDSVWIGPFDQLVSAGYALLRAEKLEYRHRSLSTYYYRVHAKIVDLCVASETADEDVPSDPALRDFAGGIYFNAGIQRLTFGVERLVATFAGIPCTCGKAAETAPTVTRRGTRWPDFGDYRKGANRRLNHSHFQGLLPALTKMLTQFDGWDGRTFVLNKGLSILRQQVNQRKHGPYMRQYAKASAPVTAAGDPSWSPVQQLELAVTSYEIGCEVYRELVDWNPSAVG
jgi:hypothetical protein